MSDAPPTEWVARIVFACVEAVYGRRNIQQLRTLTNQRTLQSLQIMQATRSRRLSAHQRLGIGHPGVKSEVAAYVLRKPPAVERLSIDHTVDESLRCLDLMLDGAMDKAMMKIHAKPPRPKPARPAGLGPEGTATVPSPPETP